MILSPLFSLQTNMNMEKFIHEDFHGASGYNVPLILQHVRWNQISKLNQKILNLYRKLYIQEKMIYDIFKTLLLI